MNQTNKTKTHTQKITGLHISSKQRSSTRTVMEASAIARLHGPSQPGPQDAHKNLGVTFIMIKCVHTCKVHLHHRQQ